MFMRVPYLQFGIATLLLVTFGFALYANRFVPVPPTRIQPVITVTKWRSPAGDRSLSIRVVFADSTAETYEEFDKAFIPDDEKLDWVTVSKGNVIYRFARPGFPQIDSVRTNRPFTSRMIETYAKVREFVAKNSEVDQIPWSEVKTTINGENRPYRKRIPLTKDFQRAVPKDELEGL